MALEKNAFHRVGIIAPHSPVPLYELGQGVELLTKRGFDLDVHSQVRARKFIFAGDVEKRVSAFLEFAGDPSIDILWAARGGYGGVAFIEELARRMPRRPRGRPKTYIGFSDSTALFSFLRDQWNWNVIHGPMPGVGRFQNLTTREWAYLLSAIDHYKSGKEIVWSGVRPLNSLAERGTISGPLVGGNISVLSALVGTAFEPKWKDRIIFLEDVGETFARIDRLVSHLMVSKRLTQGRAIILGNFKDCRDTVAEVQWSKNRRAPLRKLYSLRTALKEIFSGLEIPVWYGMDVGHDDPHYALPIGENYRVGNGKLVLLSR